MKGNAMKTLHDAAIAVFAALVASTIFISDKSTKAETGGPTTALTKTQLQGNYVTASSGAGEKSDLVITRVFEAPVETVWKAWTDPQHVMRWWGPTGFTACECKIDFRVGGKYVFCMRAPKEFQDGKEFYNAGIYKKIVPLKLIEYSQGLSDKDGNRIDPATMGMPPDFPKEIPSALAFKRVGDKTELTVTEYGWTVGQMREMSEAGMNQCLDKLAAALAKH
jgi:uncharacterized protein YndB with AHSA1/START domain